MQTFERCDILSDGELIVISVSWDRTGHEGFIADARGAIRAQSRAVAFFSSRDGKLVSHGDHARDSSSHDTFQNSRDIHVTSHVTSVSQALLVPGHRGRLTRGARGSRGLVPHQRA